MIKLGSKVISFFCFIIISFSLVFGPLNSDLNALSLNQNDELIEKIANDFSKKFCNGIGFGLSEYSAKNFAMKENMAIFKNKKGIQNIDHKSLAEKVSMSVANKCGYPLNFSKDEYDFNFEK